ncbi:putative ATP-dependent RNA helicase TDRD12 isoform X1 [Oryzias melastigma]|uniref:putative ATP-dependent RNA helicase TDRD12 isoform X1 n=1 Tax=Oryzias melastigma TaxID=30732 RepID=UPI000CF7F53E|nr:putative ATP-dependent RNA helicase TDRD12 isoform X1 [Oryzias melastigma]
MSKIFIQKIESPSCLWCRVIQEPGVDTETAEQYSKLQARMNLFYNDLTQDQSRLIPTSFEENEVYAVFWEERKFWCRVVVKSITVDSVTCLACCFLVDYGERIVVSSDKIRLTVPDFLQLPFWAQKFHLSGIKPTTLRVPFLEEKAELIPSSQWDISATLYLHSLLKASLSMEAVLLESESDSTAIELYLSTGDFKICVNDELVSKKFAYYSEESGRGGLDPWGRIPVKFCSILTQIDSASSIKLEAVKPPPTSVKPEQPLEVEAEDLLASYPQDDGCDLEVLEKQLSSSSISMSDPEPCSAVSDSLEDTDSCLAASLGKNQDLFRFLKHLNPDDKTQHSLPGVGLDEELNMCRPVQKNKHSTTWTEQKLSLKDEAVCSSEGENPAEEENGPGKLITSGRAEAGKPFCGRKDLASSCFLEWLNPGPSNPDQEDSDDAAPHCDPCLSGVLVHSSLPVEACSSLEDAPVTYPLRRALLKQKYGSLSSADCYSWPAVAQGNSTVIISHSSDQPLSFLAPILTHILLNSLYTPRMSSLGPMVLVLCPGWERVQMVFSVLEETKVSESLHPDVALLGVGKDQAKNFKLPKNCLMLVTTPFTMVRLLSCHCRLFQRLYHLVLDEADQLFARAPDQMKTILQHFHKVVSTEEKTLYPQQLVCVAKRWSPQMEAMVTAYMPYPSIVITIPEEAGLYGNVQQIVLMTVESMKISVLMGVLDFSPLVCQKTLIIANSSQDVDYVYEAVSSKSAFCLKTHEGLTHQFDSVVQQWSKDIGAGSHLILVTTDECLKCLGIRDATCVVHYEFPAARKWFGRRLFCMFKNFRNLSKQTQRCSSVARSVLLVSEKDSRHIVGVMRYLRRTDALLPPELLAFEQGVLKARDEQKMSRPLCSYLKSFGVCRDSSVCPDRHTFSPLLDRSTLPAAGIIEVVPLFIKTASVFCGRLVRKEDREFDEMVSGMASYYADKKPEARDLQEGGLYAVQEEDFFHRVKILSLPKSDGSLFFCVYVRFIDVGREKEVKSYQILKLPEHFHSLPEQAVEITVCGVKPADAEIDWHPKVIRTISQKIRGLQHRATAVLSLGNTIFVDPMVRVTQVPGMKTLINEYNVQLEILNTGMGFRNPDHLDLLKALCQDEKACSHKEDVHPSGFWDMLSCVNVRTTAENGESSEPRKSVESTNKSLVQIPPPPEVPLVSACGDKSPFDSRTVGLERSSVSAEQMKKFLSASISNGRENGRAGNPSLCKNDVFKGADRKSTGQIPNSGLTDCRNSAKSFHPQVCWYQTSQCVIVTVRLMNPENQFCDFFPDRVTYSGTVNGRIFRTCLDLQHRIAVDRCSWEMKSNQPVLKLVKQQQGHWDRLVRVKNIFVTFDTEHLDDDKDEESDGRWFRANTGEEDVYVNSECDSESD